jgi:undecaprenyl diphosphate synthase
VATVQSSHEQHAGSDEHVALRRRFTRLPNHVGVIPDGNRRWAVAHGRAKHDGYVAGLAPGLKLFRLCAALGVRELTYYGFTTDNTRRARVQADAFRAACVEAVRLLSNEAAELRVIGNTESAAFPPELLPFTERTTFGDGNVKVNFLVNYGWEWDLSHVTGSGRSSILGSLHSHDVSHIDLIIRWGGRRRLSGFLPLQAVYADFFVVDDYWPDYQDAHVVDALDWYQRQDVTRGG